MGEGDVVAAIGLKNVGGCLFRSYGARIQPDLFVHRHLLVMF